MESLKEAKTFLRNNFKDGTECPCCGQLVKLYKRKLNSGMARTLILMYANYQQQPVNVKDFLRVNSLKNNHDWTLLKHWGFIKECLKETNNNKKSSGVWNVTNTGVKFIKNHITTASHILIYNNKFQGYSDTQTNIIKALGDNFNYPELMKGI